MGSSDSNIYHVGGNSIAGNLASKPICGPHSFRIVLVLGLSDGRCHAIYRQSGLESISRAGSRFLSLDRKDQQDPRQGLGNDWPPEICSGFALDVSWVQAFDFEPTGRHGHVPFGKYSLGAIPICRLGGPFNPGFYRM